MVGYHDSPVLGLDFSDSGVMVFNCHVGWRESLFGVNVICVLRKSEVEVRFEV